LPKQAFSAIFSYIVIQICRSKPEPICAAANATLDLLHTYFAKKHFAERQENPYKTNVIQHSVKSEYFPNFLLTLNLLHTLK
jgi:hypothetical protein